MCHNVHMKTVSIRDLHLATGRLVRRVAQTGALVITDRGRPVATLQAFDGLPEGRPLPNRETWIRTLPRVDVDSVDVLSEIRGRY